MKFIFLYLCIGIISLCANASDKYQVQSSHPRIILTKEGELSLRFLLLENEGAKKIESSLKKDAEKLLGEKVSDVNKIKVSPAFSGGMLSNVSTLTLAYRIFEEDKYADKAIEHLMNICRKENWNFDDPVIMADFVTAVAIGYDWMYYHLNREEREVLINSLVRKGLNPGLELLEGKDSNPDNILSKNPQAALIFSSAMSMGALAAADFFPDLKSKVLYRVLVNNQKNFESISFNDFHNNYSEQWSRNADFLAMMLSSFQASLGHDFNISSIASMKTFASEYFAFIKDKKEEGQVLNPALLFFGKLNNDTEVPEYYVARINETTGTGGSATKLNYLCLPWLLE